MRCAFLGFLVLFAAAAQPQHARSGYLRQPFAPGLLLAEDEAAIHDLARAGVGHSLHRHLQSQRLAELTLDRTQMQVEDKLVNLSPGMAVTVEIKTGSRRIISYLMSPLVRYKQEMLRER